MSGYSNHNLFGPEYSIGDTDFNPYVNNPGHSRSPTNKVMNNHGISISVRGAIPQHQQHQHENQYQQQQQNQNQYQQQPQQQQPQSQLQSLLYDMSSFDPLQAQALQLSASAGMATVDLLAAVAAPGIASGLAGTYAEDNNNLSIGANINSNINYTPAPGIGAGMSHSASSFSHSQAQAPAHGGTTYIAAAPDSISEGQLRPIQSGPTPNPNQATSTQHPYIFIQPQQITPNGVASVATTVFNPNGTPATADPNANALLLPSAAPGGVHGTAAAQATAGLGTHHLLFNPAFLTAAAAQGVPGLAAAAAASGSPGQVLQHHNHTRPQAATQKQAQQHHNAHAHGLTANALGHPALILSAAINPHQALSQSHAHSRKRPLGGGLGLGLGLMNEIAPSVASSATPLMEANKRQRGSVQTKKIFTAEEGAKIVDPVEKRRYERNLREQQRSSKISSQIKELREVLSDCNVPFKPNKYSILLKVVEYITQLQSRAIMLDAEHQKLIITVQQTNEMITGAANNTTCGTTDNESLDTTCQDGWQQGDRINTHALRGGSSDSELCFVKGIDYRSVFEQCPTAFGIAALDGRILECNEEFLNLLGYPAREDLLKQSLFNLVHNHQDIFKAMAQMLKTAEEPTPNSTTINATAGANDDMMDKCWTGPVTSKQNITVSWCSRGCIYF
jgi:hypothetical protein